MLKLRKTCPFCKSKLLFVQKYGEMRIHCDYKKHIGHYFEYSCDLELTKINRVWIRDSKNNLNINFCSLDVGRDRKEITVNVGAKTLTIPYFEPNLFKIKREILKVKTMLILI